MESHMKCKDCTKKTKQKFKHSKPYWSETLTKLWREMNMKEQMYIKCKGTYGQKQSFKQDFLLARSKFDKALRSSERQYNKQFLDKLEIINTTNPKDFWNTIKYLGPRKQCIPMEVEINGKRCSDKNIVLEKWASEFENLLNENMGNVRIEEQYSKIVMDLPRMESDSNDNGFLNHDLLMR